MDCSVSLLALQASQGKISENLMQRLKLKPQKIKQLAEGIRSIANQDEPIRRVSTLYMFLPQAGRLGRATSSAEALVCIPQQDGVLSRSPVP